MNSADRKPEKKALSLSEVVIDTDKSDFDSMVRLLDGSHELTGLNVRMEGGNPFHDEDGLDIVDILNNHSSTLRQSIFWLGIAIVPLRYPKRVVLEDISHFNMLEFLQVPVEMLLGVDPDNPRHLH